MKFKLDHCVVNIDRKYQTNQDVINGIRDKGFPYEPKWGKGSSGFKASNLWIGDEYFEMISILKRNGGGWKQDWVDRYNSGHRGLICLMLDVEDIEALYSTLRGKDIAITTPQYLQFKWFFRMFTRTMPWRNAYLDFFEGVPLQIGFQQMKDDKSREFMRQYMVPNSRDNSITAIKEVTIKGGFSKRDLQLIRRLFGISSSDNDNRVEIGLSNQCTLIFEMDTIYKVYIKTYSDHDRLVGNKIQIENIEMEIS